MSKPPKQEKKRSPAGAPASRQDRIVLALWEQCREQLLTGLEIFEKIAVALEGGSPDEGLRQKASAEAHKLIGSFGILKIKEGARVASSLEDLLNGPEIPPGAPVTIRESVSLMRRLLMGGPPR